MTENNAFISFENDEAGLIFDDSLHESYPIAYYNVINGKGLTPSSGKSYYGFVYDGYLVVTTQGLTHQICTYMYFSFTGPLILEGQGKAIFIEVDHNNGIYPQTAFHAMSVLGGPIEKKGRLRYIDGCTDSLLIPPVKMGDPCLNHLHFPPEIDQTAHTHPSHRIGIVASGHGECVTPFGNLPLTEGMIFVIKEWNGKDYAEGLDGEMHPIGTHKFKTFNRAMDVIAFHPDSDFGPTDVDHPMINRTIVEGVSAKNLSHLQTK